MLTSDGAQGSRVESAIDLDFTAARYTSICCVFKTPPAFETNATNGTAFLFGQHNQGTDEELWFFSVSADPFPQDGPFTRFAPFIGLRDGDSGTVVHAYYDQSADVGGAMGPPIELEPDTEYHVVMVFDNQDFDIIDGYVDGVAYAFESENGGPVAAFPASLSGLSFMGTRGTGGAGFAANGYGLVQWGYVQSDTAFWTEADAGLLAGVTDEGVYHHPMSPALSVPATEVITFNTDGSATVNSANDGSDEGGVSYVDNPSGVELRGEIRPDSTTGIDFRVDITNGATADATPNSTSETIGNSGTASFFRGVNVFDMPDLDGGTLNGTALTYSYADGGVGSDVDFSLFCKNADAALITEATAHDNIGALNASGVAFTVIDGGDTRRINSTDLTALAVAGEWAKIAFVQVRDDETTQNAEFAIWRTCENATESFRPMFEWFYTPAAAEESGGGGWQSNVTQLRRTRRFRRAASQIVAN